MICCQIRSSSVAICSAALPIAASVAPSEPSEEPLGAGHWLLFADGSKAMNSRSRSRASGMRREAEGHSTTPSAGSLHRRRGVPLRLELPDLTEEQILGWADAYYRRTGLWPSAHSESIADGPPSQWITIESCLREG